jgi:hypothetical protein
MNMEQERGIDNQLSTIAMKNEKSSKNLMVNLNFKAPIVFSRGVRSSLQLQARPTQRENRANERTRGTQCIHRKANGSSASSLYTLLLLVGLPTILDV